MPEHQTILKPAESDTITIAELETKLLAIFSKIHTGYPKEIKKKRAEAIREALEGAKGKVIEG